MKINDRLIVPLDVEKLNEAESIVNELEENITTYKVGLQLYTREGQRVIKMLKKYEKKIFLDLKFHDIPNTVVGAVKSALELGIDMLTIHAMGGFDMMEGVAKLLWQRRNDGKHSPTVFAVTLLTSLDSAFLMDVIGTTNRSVEDEVVILAGAAQSAGINGVVAAPQEIKSIRKKYGKELLILTPGIRPAGSDKNDQQRIATPFSAIKDGADYIVVGRPILQSENKIKTVKNILKEMRDGLKNS
ncbi:TPA: orotidine-5'-phosphate decarboxylase [candidate division WOR-3 bacterium]|uniref:Orotidine 5'-phosphate decarboxylase n=1 Tax=candidate division WOR-3 bacterium TaxID=2052148 RepID=A0A350H8W4_UNCW3|nr:orotidine-5'-phosphate decarboxylase [candidate division WOR-3 bacterium]